MTKKASLFNPDVMIDDLFIRSLSPLTRLFYFLLMALANKNGDGRIHKGDGAALSWAQAAMFLGFDGDIDAAAAEIGAMRSLIECDELGLFIPQIRAAAILRAKRQAAGAAGGMATTAQRDDVMHEVKAAQKIGSCAALDISDVSHETDTENHGRTVCLSKNKTEVAPRKKANGHKASNVKSFKKALQKKKKNQKEKNNKYIYILQKKVLMDDAGGAANGVWLSFPNFTVYRREYEALREVFPAFGEERLDQLLAGHSEFIEKNPHFAPAVNDNWRAPLLKFLRGIHDKLAA